MAQNSSMEGNSDSELSSNTPKVQRINSESDNHGVKTKSPYNYTQSISEDDLVLGIEPNPVLSRRNSKKSRLDSLTDYPAKGSLRKAVLQLLAIFLIGSVLVWVIFKNLPEMDEGQTGALEPDYSYYDSDKNSTTNINQEIINSKEISSDDIKFPKNLNETRNLGRAVKSYVKVYPFSSYFIYFFLFVFLQSFFIPTSFLSVISGMIFNPFIAIICLAICSAIGSLINYYLASTIGIIIVDRYFRKSMNSWRNIITKSKFDLIRYLIFLRMIPVPAWSVNIACAIFRVDPITFFLTTLFGVIPMNTIFILTGRELEDVIENPSVWNWQRIVGILCLCSAVLAPSIIKKYCFSENDDKGSFEKLDGKHGVIADSSDHSVV